MIKCKICGKEFDSGDGLKDQQAAHCHLLRVHYKQYQKKRFSRAAFTESSGEIYKKEERGLRKSTKRKPEEERDTRPAGFRPLDRTVPEEAAAYEEGFRYVDADENVYDRAEAREKGWI